MSKSIIKKENIIDLVFIIIGSFISSMGINMFLTHARLLSGGVTGIALIIQYVFNIQAGILIILLNIPLFVISFLKLDRKFTIYSLVGTITLSVALIITHPIANVLNINDKLLYCLYGGVVNGIGFGLVFTHNGSTGGFDIISMIVRRKYSNINLGKISFAINLIIVSVSAFIFGLSSALYTLIAMYITSFVLDNVVKGFNQRKMVLIITEKEEEVSKIIMTKLGRGVTYLYGEGAYTEVNKKILYCIVQSSQVPEIKRIVTNIDKKAFLTFVDATEVQGKGFKNAL
ncbi:YitT family protein [Clostridium omnivorum]|uniref:Membrane protein n=1 Tax=Clostridium omnivorum TaxID=1604902 RepID=A0ABQ5N8X9_9CLOT|nr:YitT family protein [Clostridium sp. E14]GLC31655.1 membrane protein [Clostridium sp. E14]